MKMTISQELELARKISLDMYPGSAVTVNPTALQHREIAFKAARKTIQELRWSDVFECEDDQ